MTVIIVEVAVSVVVALTLSLLVVALIRHKWSLAEVVADIQTHVEPTKAYTPATQSQVLAASGIAAAAPLPVPPLTIVPHVTVA